MYLSDIYHRSQLCVKHIHVYTYAYFHGQIFLFNVHACYEFFSPQALLSIISSPAFLIGNGLEAYMLTGIISLCHSIACAINYYIQPRANYNVICLLYSRGTCWLILVGTHVPQLLTELEKRILVFAEWFTGYT